MNATAAKPKKQEQQQTSSQHWSREGLESIVIAVILALLFRTFEAEAFVIPTGSMAPTLQGRHKDITCSECGYRYRSGAALRQEMGGMNPVVETTCPMCRYVHRVDRNHRNEDSFSGDRILVNKFAYQYGQPERWDVIVFKYPGNAKQNYIKRLVGLPGETLRINHGDVFARADQASDFEIARKPPAKLVAMLQLVSDTNRIPESLIKADWSASWSDLSDSGSWSATPDRKEYTLRASEDVQWLRYRHIEPSRNDWVFIRNANRPPDVNRKRGALITGLLRIQRSSSRTERSVTKFGEPTVPATTSGTIRVRTPRHELGRRFGAGMRREGQQRKRSAAFGSGRGRGALHLPFRSRHREGDVVHQRQGAVCGHRRALTRATCRRNERAW